MLLSSWCAFVILCDCGACRGHIAAGTTTPINGVARSRTRPPLCCGWFQEVLRLLLAVCSHVNVRLVCSIVLHVWSCAPARLVSLGGQPACHALWGARRVSNTVVLCVWAFSEGRVWQLLSLVTVSGCVRHFGGRRKTGQRRATGCDATG